MKNLSLIPLLFGLSGCSVWNAYTMAHFDNNEYQYATELRTSADAAVGECGDKEATLRNVRAISLTATNMANYTQYIPRNKESHEVSVSMTKITDELNGKKDMSEAYCKIKFKLIKTNAEKIQQVLGSKPR
jgi:hypothetical protein